MKKLVILSMAGALALALLTENAVAESSFYVFGTFGNTNSDISFTTRTLIFPSLLRIVLMVTVIATR